MTVPAAFAFGFLRPVGLIAKIPYWVVVTLLLSADLVNTFVVALLPDAANGWRRATRIGVEMAVIAAVVYGIGWGPLLAVGFVFGAADAMRASNAEAARPAITFTVLCMGLGQLAIFLRLTPTLVRQPLVHGLGVLGALGAVFTIKVIQWFAASRESSEARFRALVQNASDIVAVVNEARTFSWVSPSFTRTLGWSVADFEARPAADLLHPEDHQTLFVLADRNRDTGDQVLRSELRLRHADGSWRWFEATVSNRLDDPNVRGLVANLHDVTDRKTLEEELRHQAFHDSLTGLANRALFVDRLEHALSLQARSGRRLAVLLVDFDDFKAINDSLGHGVGDSLLTDAAKRLRATVRASDTVARLGGDEFAILVENPVAGDEPEQVADRVVAAFSEPMTLGERSLTLSASVGLAINPAGFSSADDLVRNADVAMYAAKANGKGCWVRFEPGMYVAAQRRLELKNDLVEAISSGDQMELYYQPIVDLRSRKPVGVEALLRWNHPRHHLVTPVDFLLFAEESGLIVPLGRWVLNQALSQLSTWRKVHPGLRQMTMSVNVSGRQLDDPGFVAEVRDALDEHGLDASQLVLEITESALVRDFETVVGRLHELKALGLSLAIDDFGTGYSSLGYLKSFPVDILKIDQSFIAEIVGPARQAALAEAIVRMGTVIGLQTIAEGVEREGQAERLEALGCCFGQGFLFGQPLSASACESFIAKAARRVGSRATAR